MSAFETGAEAYHRQDFETAAKEWQVAADGGDIESLYHLGLLHANGLGTEKSYEKAMEYFKRLSNTATPRPSAIWPACTKPARASPRIT
jgi:TPR repeat protein